MIGGMRQQQGGPGQNPNIINQLQQQQPGGVMNMQQQGGNMNMQQQQMMQQLQQQMMMMNIQGRGGMIMQ